MMLVEDLPSMGVRRVISMGLVALLMTDTAEHRLCVGRQALKFGQNQRRLLVIVAMRGGRGIQWGQGGSWRSLGDVVAMVAMILVEALPSRGRVISMGCWGFTDARHRRALTLRRPLGA
jgi:hypothetical protein